MGRSALTLTRTFEFVQRVFPGLTGSEVSWRISDHYPLWCEFLTN